MTAHRTASTVLAAGVAALAGAALASCSSGGGGGPPPVEDVRFTSFQPATLVLGQPDFTHGDFVEAASTTMHHPYGMPALAGGVLWIPEWSGNRVLGFAGIPAASGAAAQLVLGQPDFVSTAAGAGASGLSGPLSVEGAGGKLLVADVQNHRVLVWNETPTATGAPAGVAVGQPTLDDHVAGCSSVSLRAPQAIRVVDGKLIVSDTGNHRVLVWNRIPTASGTPADLVVGQQDLVSCDFNDPDGAASNARAVTASTLNYPIGLWSDGTRLVVVDTWNYRVLVWSTFPTRNGAPADLVLGQPGFGVGTLDPAGVGTTSFRVPVFVDSDGRRLLVSDHDAHRVLVWNGFPAASGAVPDAVLGQSSFRGSAPNDDDQDGSQDLGPSARTLRSPAGIRLVGTRLLVPDYGNHRVLVFDPR